MLNSTIKMVFVLNSSYITQLYYLQLAGSPSMLPPVRAVWNYFWM